MDIRKVKKLIDLVEESSIAELEIHEEKESIRIVSSRARANSVHNVMVSESNDQAKAKEPQNNGTPEIEPVSNRHAIVSPMVGTVFLSATPGAKHFVEIGQRVAVGDTLCLIEAMKMFNRIEADKAGVIASRLVDNEQPVEFGQALFEIE